VLAIRLLSSRDVREELRREVSKAGKRVVLAQDSGIDGMTWRATLEEIKRALVYSKSLRRAPDLETVARQGGVDRDAIVLSDLAPKTMRPAFVLFRDVNAKRLVFVIRGTHSAKDMITNLTGSVCPHHFMVNNEVKVGYAHSGFLTTARYLQRTMKDELSRALKNNRGYEMHIIGHSLGGGVAVLLTEMLRQEPEFAAAGLRCYTFACPSTLSRELAESCQPFVTTCVNNADIVPFVSFSKISELQSEVVKTALEQQFLRKWRATKAAMTSAQGPTPSRFAAAAAAVDQCYGPQRYPKWLRAMQTLKNRHDNLIESSSLYRKSLLLGKRVSKTSSRLASLSGAFIAGIIAPRVRWGADESKVTKSVDTSQESQIQTTTFAKTKQQVGDFMSASVFAKDIDGDVDETKSERSAEECEFDEYVAKARTALEQDFEKPLTAEDLVKMENVEGAAAQEVLAMQEDVGVFCAAEMLGDEKADELTDSAEKLPLPRMEAPTSLDPEYVELEPVVKRIEKPGDAALEREKRDRVLLYPAGRMLHFVHNVTTEPTLIETEPSPISPPSTAKFIAYSDVNLDVYSRIILSRTMIADHFLYKYEEVLNAVLEESPPSSSTVAAQS